MTLRFLTGILGGALLLGLLVFGGRAGIYVLTAVLSWVMVGEFSKMVFVLPDSRQKRAFLICCALGVIALHFMGGIGSPLECPLFMATFIILFIYFLFTARRHRAIDLGVHFQELMSSLFGFTYLVFVPLCLPKMYCLNQGNKWTILFFLIVFSGDTAAFFVGRKFGKKKLYPKISPNKTIEGSIAGLCMGVMISLLFQIVFLQTVSLGAVVFLALLVGGMAQVGDFCESFLKRAFDKKDAGLILPGHGGFLDRFDGIVFSLPMMYLFTYLLS